MTLIRILALGIAVVLILTPQPLFIAAGIAIAAGAILWHPHRIPSRPDR